MIRLAIVTSTVPKTLSKSFELGPDNTLDKRSGGAVAKGRAEIREVDGLAALAALLKALGPNQALTYGLPAESPTRILSRKAFETAGRPADALTRTRGCFAWPEGPGIMMLDHDAQGEDRLTRNALVALLREAAPGLAGAALLWWPSASSYIHETSTGRDLTGLRGQRLYLAVADARDIPRAGQALVERFWAAGHGRIAVSGAGSALERCPVDASVWQPERLDFAAGAICGAGLEQRRGEPVLLDGDPIVDTREALPDDPGIRSAADRQRRDAKASARPELEAARDAWCERRADTILAEEDRDDPEKRKAAIDTARRAVQNGVLTGQWPIEIESGPGVFSTVTVGQILEDRARFHGCLTRDPIEPDYDGGRTVGKLYLLDARPKLFSFAHGGRTFRLVRAPHRIEIVKGHIAEAVDATLEVLRQDPGTFDFGGRVAVVEDGRIETLEEPALAHHLAGILQFWRWQVGRGDQPVPQDIDPPQPLVRQIVSLGRRRGLKALDGVVTVPMLRPDGSLLDTPGYDEATRLFYDAGGDEVPPVPEYPSRVEVDAALDTLTRPFRSFPFANPLAEAACLAALLTAVLRPCLPTAPAFAVDAPVQGSGKTLLASCCAALATGRAPEVWPHTASRDDEEVRKRLFAALLGGAGAIVWDNVVGVLDSPSLAAVLTAPVYRDRVLGRSESVTLPNRALLLITGNNLCLAGDLPRRVIACRIDPETPKPFARRFDRDPLASVLSRRAEMAVAALTLVRGMLAAGGPRAEGRMASFEPWDDLVRQTVCWIDREIAPGRFGDPMDLVLEAQARDPEQEALAALLDALSTIFGDRWFTAREVHVRAREAAQGFVTASDAERALAEALADIGGAHCISSTRSVGRVLSFRADRIAMGLRIRLRTGGKVNEFRVDRLKNPDDCRFGRFDRFDSHPSRENDGDDTYKEGPETNRANRSNRTGDGPAGMEDIA
jgi:hypothetical protein